MTKRYLWSVYMFGAMAVVMSAATGQAQDGTVQVKFKYKPGAGWRENTTRTVELLNGHSRKAIKRNAYGSRLDQQEAATGFFHTKKINGRWWLIDPEGYRHFNLAVVAVRPGGGPAQEQAFAKEFGSDQEWADATSDMLKVYGFSGTGAWSNDDLLRKAKTRLNYCVNWDFMGKFGRSRTYMGSGNRKYPQSCIFVFDPDWPAFCETHAEKIAELKDDPYLLGHFFDNELPLMRGMIHRYLKLPETDHGHKAARAFLEKHGGSSSKISKEVEGAFDKLVAEMYMEPIAQAIKKVDPNHMLLGPRMNHTPIDGAVIGKHVDAFAFNLYGVWSPAKKARDLVKAIGKPLIVTEYYTKGMDVEGLTNESGAGWCVPTQNDRGLFYQNYGLDLLESKVCVGWQWFKYQDNDPTNLKTDPSNRNSNKGIINNNYTPYDPLMEKMQELNTQVYSIIDLFDARE